MDIMVGILDAFLTCVIISKIYSRICEISKKERYIFGFIFFIFQLIYAFIFSFIDSDKLILILHYTLKNFYPILFYCYFKFIKKYDSSKNIFLSLIFSLLYQSAHTFFSVTISSITGDLLVEQHERLFFFIINLISYLVIDKIITYFNLELKYFDKDYLYPFLKKL